MKFRPFITALPFLFWVPLASAQLPEEDSSSMPQWQVTVEMIKSKAQTLMVQNTGLQDEKRQLEMQVQKYQQMIDEQQNKNQQMEDFLNGRHGRSDQQLRIDELNQTFKAKSKHTEDLEGQLANLQKKKAAMDSKIEQLKFTISGLELRLQAPAAKSQAQPAAPTSVDDGLSTWRKQLEDASQQEAILGSELETLKTGDKSQNVNVTTIEDQNRQLEARLDMLRLQKLRHLHGFSDTLESKANALRYDQLRKRRDLLEANISAYESRLDSLRESSLMSLSWPLKKKRMVHELVQKDAFNNQMRGKIKVLREDIDVLKDQVARLERRLDFAKDKSSAAPSTSHWVDLKVDS